MFAKVDPSRLSFGHYNNNFWILTLLKANITIVIQGYLNCDFYPNSTLSAVCKLCTWTSIKYYLYGGKVAAMDDCTPGLVDKLC